MVNLNGGSLNGEDIIRYEPFGDFRGNARPDDITDRSFTGHQGNKDIGLVYMKARYYLPGVGRFASADTIVPNPANPQSLNRYSYVLNRPTGFTDPSGHCGADANMVMIWIPEQFNYYTGWDSVQSKNNYEDCVEIRDHLEYIYGISITGEWTLEEIRLLQGAFNTLKDFLSSEIGVEFPIQAIHDMLDGAEYSRVRRQNTRLDCLCNARVTAVTSGRGNKVSFFDDTFWDFGKGTVRESIDVYETIIHETAHVWDSSNGRRYSNNMVEALGGQCPFRICNVPEGRISEAGNRYEDWAISFARTVTGNDIGSITDPRQVYIRDLLTVNFVQ